MYTEEEFYQIIEDRTGLERKNYGFIDGTLSPYTRLGHTSSDMVSGFDCWVKKTRQNGKEYQIRKRFIGNKDHTEDIIQFLNFVPNFGEHGEMIITQEYIDKV